MSPDDSGRDDMREARVPPYETIFYSKALEVYNGPRCFGLDHLESVLLANITMC